PRALGPALEQNLAVDARNIGTSLGHSKTDFITPCSCGPPIRRSTEGVVFTTTCERSIPKPREQSSDCPVWRRGINLNNWDGGLNYWVLGLIFELPAFRAMWAPSSRPKPEKFD